jgi:hypothetical protein
MSSPLESANEMSATLSVGQTGKIKVKKPYVYKPNVKTIIDELNRRGLPETPENKDMVRLDLIARVKSYQDAQKYRREKDIGLKKTTEEKLVRTGMASVPRQRPTVVAEIPGTQSNIHTLDELRTSK